MTSLQMSQSYVIVQLKFDKWWLFIISISINDDFFYKGGGGPIAVLDFRFFYSHFDAADWTFSVERLW